jgi:hypothetical protein
MSSSTFQGEDLVLVSRLIAVRAPYHIVFRLAQGVKEIAGGR